MKEEAESQQQKIFGSKRFWLKSFFQSAAAETTSPTLLSQQIQQRRSQLGSAPFHSFRTPVRRDFLLCRREINNFNLINYRI